jgi:hypothetical protein
VSRSAWSRACSAHSTARSLSPLRKASRPHLLVEVRPLDVLTIAVEQGEPSLEALERPRADAGVPVKASHLAKDTRLRRRVPLRAVSGLDDVVLAERGPSPSGRTEEIGHALPGHEPLRLRRVAMLEGIERPLIVLDGIGVGIHPARPIARRHQVARAPALVGAERPVVAEGHQPFETLRVTDALGFEGGPDPAVQSVRRATRMFWYTISWRSP